MKPLATLKRPARVSSLWKDAYRVNRLGLPSPDRFAAFLRSRGRRVCDLCAREPFIVAIWRLKERGGPVIRDDAGSHYVWPYFLCRRCWKRRDDSVDRIERLFDEPRAPESLN